MLRQLKKALVESFVGAIALGLLFSQGILHFAGAFSSPFAMWFTRRQFSFTRPADSVPLNFSLQDAAPELIRSFVIILVGYFLLRWLYFTPVALDTDETQPEPVSESRN